MASERILIGAGEIAAQRSHWPAGIAARLRRALDRARRGSSRARSSWTAALARALAEIPGGPRRRAARFHRGLVVRNAHRSSGEVRLVQDTTHHIEGRHVVVVENIVDNGHTLHYLRGMLENRNPASLRAAVLLDKPYHRAIDVPIDYRA